MSTVERTSSLTISQACDGNQCAAILLEYFYRDVPLNATTGADAKRTVISLDDLGTIALNRFSRDDIYLAVWLLHRKEYIWSVIQFYGYIESRKFGKDLLTECVCYSITDAGMALSSELPSIELIEQQHKRKITLEQKYKSESARVMYHNRRAEEYGLPATLTLEQWITTLDHFGWKCAYCQGKYTVLEHFVPLGYEEGTIWANCVPSCHSCNSAKGPFHPKALPAKMMMKWGRILLNVEQYLETRRSEVER